MRHPQQDRRSQRQVVHHRPRGHRPRGCPGELSFFIPFLSLPEKRETSRGICARHWTPTTPPQTFVPSSLRVPDVTPLPSTPSPSTTQGRRRTTTTTWCLPPLLSLKGRRGGMKNDATIKSIDKEDQVTTTSTSHKSSSHLAPSQVHLPSPVSPKLQSESSVDLLSLISQAPLIRTRLPERALMDADYHQK